MLLIPYTEQVRVCYQVVRCRYCSLEQLTPVRFRKTSQKESPWNGSSKGFRVAYAKT